MCARVRLHPRCQDPLRRSEMAKNDQFPTRFSPKQNSSGSGRPKPGAPNRRKSTRHLTPSYSPTPCRYSQGMVEVQLSSRRAIKLFPTGGRCLVPRVPFFRVFCAFRGWNCRSNGTPSSRPSPPEFRLQAAPFLLSVFQLSGFSFQVSVSSFQLFSFSAFQYLCFSASRSASI